MGASQNYSVNLNINANTDAAKTQLQSLQQQLQQIANIKIDADTGTLTQDIQAASQAAMQLSAHLATATNQKTGNLDFTKFYSSIQKSGSSLEEYGAALQKMGPAGQKAFVNLADSISKSEIPLKRTSALMDNMWANLKKTVGWQISSSMVNSFVGSIQQAVGYAKDLNSSLTDIRIVTGSSAEQMASFAKEANNAAKKLSTTTTDYTKASLIYYQQGLSDAEVKARTEATIKMANATGTSASKVSDQMTAVWNNFYDGSKSLEYYQDVMTALGAATASSTDEISEGVNKFAATAKTVGLSYEYATAGLATVTAKTRESADVIGNAFKTLFARIQGLSLGETLDDGTDLNKYSLALAKVGVAVKDSSGELRSMDDILDDLGDTWDTLSTAQQTALAQTVGGVRQYSQLMALMNNWDYFKENVQVAKSSEGTTDQQAAIYAESWQAASDRVRASWEGLWDTLIDSNSAIELLDFISNFATGMDKIATSLGGMKGTLGAVGALVTRVFSKQISENVGEIGASLRSIMPGYSQKFEEKRNQILTNFSGMIEDTAGTNESAVRASIMRAQVEEGKNRTQRYARMTPEEKLLDQQIETQQQQFREKQLEASATQDSSMQSRYERTIANQDLFEGKAYTGGKDAIKARQIQEAQQQLEAEEQEFKMQKVPLLGTDEYDVYSEKKKDLEQRRQQLDSQVSQMSAKGSQYTGQTVNQYINDLVQQNTARKDLSRQIINDAKNEKGQYDADKAYADLKASISTELAEEIDVLTENISSAAEKVKIAEQKIAAEADAEYRNKVADIDVENGIPGLSTEEIKARQEKVRAQAEDAIKGEAAHREKEQYGSHVSDLEKQRDQLGSKELTWGDAFTGAIQGITASTAASESLKTLVGNWDKTSGIEKLSSAANVASMSAISTEGFSTVLEKMGMADEAATGLGFSLTLGIEAASLANEAIEKHQNALKEEAREALDSASATQAVYEQAQSKTIQLQSAIETYSTSLAKVSDVTLSSSERADAEYEHNQNVISMISEYGLTPEEYEKIGNQYQITKAGLERIQAETTQTENQAKIAADLASSYSKQAQIDYSLNEFEKDTLGTQFYQDGQMVTTTAGEYEDNAKTLGSIGVGGLVAGVAATALTAAGLATIAPIAIGALFAGGAASVLLGVAEQSVADSLTDDSIYDKAMARTKATGSASWLEDLDNNTSGFTDDEIKTLKENKEELAKILNQQVVQDEAEKIASENRVNSIMSANESLAEFSQKTKLVEGGLSTYKDTLEKTNKEFSVMTSTELANFAKMHASDLGITAENGYDQIDWDTKAKDGRVSYTYYDESGNQQTGSVSKTQIQSVYESQALSAAVQDYGLSAMQEYEGWTDKIGTNASKGLLSLLTGADMETATQAEITSLQEAIKSYNNNITELLGTEDIDGYAKQWNMTGEELQAAFNMISNDSYQTVAQKLMSQYTETYSELLGADTGKEVMDNISQETMRGLYKNLNLISSLSGEEAGATFLEGLFGMIEDSGIGKDKLETAMSSLMALDWSSYDAAGNAASILSDLGATIDTTTASWQAFAAAMQAATGAVPDFSSLLSQLTTLIGLLGQLSSGDIIDDSVLSSLLEKFPEFRDLVMKQWNGSYKFLGTEEDVKKYQNLLNNEYETTWESLNNTTKLLEKYTGEGSVLENVNASDINFDTLTASSQVSSVLTSLLASWKGITGEEMTQEIGSAQQEYNEAAFQLNKWSQDGTGVDINGQTVFRNADGDYVLADGTAVNESTKSEANKQYQVDAGRFAAAQDVMQGFINILQSLLGMTPDEIRKDASEQKASTYDTYEKFEKGLQDGDTTIANENGILTDAGAKQLINLAEQYDNTTEAVKRYKEALDAVKEGIEGADETLERAQAELQLATAIGEVAAARALDASILAEYVNTMKDQLGKDITGAIDYDKDGNLDAYNTKTRKFSEIYDSKQLAEMAADELKAAEGRNELTDAIKNYQKVSSKSTKTFDEETKALNAVTTALSKIVKIQDSVTKGTLKLGDNFKTLSKDTNKATSAMQGNFNAIKEFQGAALKDTMSDILGGKDAQGYDDAMAAVDGMVSALQNMNSTQAFVAGEAQAASADFVNSYTSLSTIAQQAGTDATTFSNTVTDAFDMDISTETLVSDTQTTGTYKEVKRIPGDAQLYKVTDIDGSGEGRSTQTITTIRPKGGGSGGGGGGGSGGGGGGGGKEPKKVANKRKSQTVTRYKSNDYKKSTNDFAKKTEEQKQDYLYGEQKIAQLEKINKLTEKEAHLNADRIKEARAYLEEDRNNLQKYLQKYGYDMELEADGYLSNYEEIWTDIYNQIAALYEDNLLDESESELEEQLNIMQEELEGALEDYEDSLQELYDTIEAYEDSLYEMYDNQVEQIEHRIEFKTELDTDQLDYMDFILEAIGDNAERAVDAIDAMGQKTSTLLDGINTYNDAIASAYEISDSPLQTLITNGVEGLLTEKQVELLRDSKDGLVDYMTQLLELRESIMEKLTEAFDAWNEKMQSSLTTIEHYGSVLEYFKNIIDVVGKDVFGLSDKFMDNLEQSAIDQANDNLEATRANYLGLLEEYEYANEQLTLARERNDESSITQWEETVRTVKEEMESAEDSMMTALENTLTLIAEQFETTMQRAVDAFNDAIYAHGGLESLSNDYSLIRENADLMAEDYEKIYNLSKLNREITKTLDDTKIIAGKSRLISLQKEINELQKSNVELSQYDLEYLQAKYDLRVAEIELENAQNAKSQVRLSKDSEGNWSYVYTQSTDAVEKAEQKYEDALYAMQELSQDYLEEMSSKMVDTSSAMMDEISALRIQDFDSYEDYQAEVKAIQDKYAESLKLQENELNKAISNSSELYQKDWQAYSQYTGYKISAASDWVDTFKESTLGGLLDADTLMSNFGDTILGLADELNKKLSSAGVNYFTNVETAMNKYGTTISGFKGTITTATSEIASKSKDATKEVQDMAKEMTSSFKDVADSVSKWQTDFSLKIDELLVEVKTMIKSINEAIKKSAELTTDNVNYDLIGAADAIDLINASGKFGTWSTGSGGNGVYVNGESTAFVDYLAQLVEDMDDAMELYYNTSSKDTTAKAEAKEKLESAILLYNEFKSIVDRLYDVSDTNMPKSKYSDKTASYDTGGYTGEWGNNGKLAMLHEKELILNKGDTENFLEAIGISRDLVNSVIELNARSSGMGLGALIATGAEGTNQQVLEQYVNITADFPNATDHSEIAEALSDLTNLASQYANR